MKMSFVIPTYRRDAMYLYNLLLTLYHQTVQVHEVVIVDMNADMYIDDYWQIKEVCDSFSFVKYISSPWTSDPDMLNVSWGMNVGIKATDPESDYLLCTGVEMLFSLNYHEIMLRDVAPDLIFLAPCGFLPPNAPLDNIIEDWSTLVSMASGDQEDFTMPMSERPWMDGTIKVATRDWWITHHGYDEMMWFKPMSDNVNRRAVSSGLKRHIIPWEQGQVLHQWHEPAWKMIENSEADWDEFLARCKMLVTNPNGWGELDGPRAS